MKTTAPTYFANRQVDAALAADNEGRSIGSDISTQETDHG